MALVEDGALLGSRQLDMGNSGLDVLGILYQNAPVSTGEGVGLAIMPPDFDI